MPVSRFDPERRRFLRLSAASTVASTFGLRAAADDAAALYQRMVPARKGLDAGWVMSLVKRGHANDAPIRGSKKDGNLDKIGMTVGGIACGTVYLNGDGRLFVWDIFNQRHEGVVAQKVDVPTGMENIAQGGKRVRERDGANYINPPTPETFPNGFLQEFLLLFDDRTVRLDSSGWAEVKFDGRWPVGRVDYGDPAIPLEATLEAWSPFIPLSLDDSSLPVTVVEITLRNPGPESVKVRVVPRLGNAVCLHSVDKPPIERRSEVMKRDGLTMLVHRAGSRKQGAQGRPDVPFESFEGEDYGEWRVEGEAFGEGPVPISGIIDYQGDLAGAGKRVVNSHSSAPGDDARMRDRATGSLTSPEFTISRKFIRMRVGGGSHKGKTCVNLLVDGEVVRGVTGADNNRMREVAIPTGKHEGRRARLQIVDAESGPWGNIGVDEIVFSDTPPTGVEKIEELPDFGTMALAVPGEHHCDGSTLIQVDLEVPTGGEVTVPILLAWHFPNLHPLPGLGRRKRHYAPRFADAAAVAGHVARNFDRLATGTRRWVETYYDSSIPRWLLDRVAAPVNTLQSANCIVLDDGRFWAWEGIGCCPGTCAHVWHYAQGPARLFPEVERNLREVTDFGVAQNADGSIRFRAEANRIPAIDAQTGVILRSWREHQCSADGAFLGRIWPGVKKALGWLIEFDRKDRDGLDGLLDGKQHNTLDAEWYGKVHCLCSMYLAALRAGEEMAREMGDDAFSNHCREIRESGSKKIEALFEGEFFVQLEDAAQRDKIGVGKGCYIDQVIGQWWAHQTGLGRIQDEAAVKSALNSLWKYNFVPDVGPFRREFTRGRFYALPGDAGLVMCSWPKGGMRDDFKKHWQYAYFNECMTGFEWQAAAHMVMEGAPITGSGFASAIEDAADPRALTLRGLAAARAIHDRYAPARRNPYNEVECSDHYARAAASWSLLLALSGFRYHGPKAEIGFAPKLNPEDFRCPFTAAEGWGTFEQKKSGEKWTAAITLRHGKLRVSKILLPWLGIEGQPTPAWNDREISRELKPGSIRFHDGLVMDAGDVLKLE